jgi:hypothetical protein
MHPLPLRLKTGLGIVAAFVTLALALPIAAQDEVWTEFSFNSSSDSYKRKGERAYDLRDGQYTAYEYTKTHSGDFIIMISYSPEWVTFRTQDWTKVLFSTSEENNAAIDKKAGQVSNCVPIYYGDSYVASFNERTYTIKLVEGGYEFPAGKAKFLYHPGGTPGPEHEPRKRSSTGRSGRSTREDEDKPRSRARDPFADSSELDEERIDKLTVTVKTGPPEDEEFPKKGRLRLVLYYQYETGDAMLSREALTFREGKTMDFTFRDVLAATYDAKVTFRGETIEKEVAVTRANTKITLAFPGAEEWERLQKKRKKVAKKPGPCGSGCGGPGPDERPRPVEKRGPPEPVEGYVRYINVCVTTPPAGIVSAERGTLTVELRGAKHLKLTRQNIRSGTSNRLKFFTFPVGTYDVIAKYEGKTASSTVNLQDDCEDVELAFPGTRGIKQKPVKKEPKPIDEVTVRITIPGRGGYGSPKAYPLTLTLNATSVGGFTTMHRDTLAVREGSVETYVFKNVRPGTYSVQITHGKKTITDSININESNTEFGFVVR